MRDCVRVLHPPSTRGVHAWACTCYAPMQATSPPATPPRLRAELGIVLRGWKQMRRRHTPVYYYYMHHVCGFSGFIRSLYGYTRRPGNIQHVFSVLEQMQHAYPACLLACKVSGACGLETCCMLACMHVSGACGLETCNVLWLACMCLVLVARCSPYRIVFTNGKYDVHGQFEWADQDVGVMSDRISLNLSNL